MRLSKWFISNGWILAGFIFLMLGYQTAMADTCASGSACVFGSSGGEENSLTKEEARQQKQSWDENRPIRKKANAIAERNIDKLEKAIIDKESCNNSLNRNAYWEPNTQRCLDRLTGRPLNP